jgi:hypothetical protein
MDEKISDNTASWQKWPVVSGNHKKGNLNIEPDLFGLIWVMYQKGEVKVDRCTSEIGAVNDLIKEVIAEAIKLTEVLIINLEDEADILAMTQVELATA